MKIAILTLPLHTNYGGILQAYALQTILERMGNTVEVLQRNSVWSHSPMIMPFVYAKRLATKFLKNTKTPIFIEYRLAGEKDVIQRNTDKFIKIHIHTREINSLKEIKPDDYDAIVVGSDQVWRKIYFSSMWNAPIDYAFLSFSKEWDIKRIAYAASFGKDDLKEYSASDIKKCAKALKKFNFVSVREDSGVGLCCDEFGVKAECCLDPTMLLSKDDYLSLINDNTPSKGNMLCYILDMDDEKRKLIDEIAAKKGLQPFNVYAPVNDRKYPAEERVQPPLEEWLKGFRDAEFVVTDSFHACVFSIIFNKPFLAIGNPERGMSRFTSLLGHFNLLDRLITKPSKTDYSNICDFTIQWQAVNEVLKTAWEHSNRVLTQAL